MVLRTGTHGASIPDPCHRARDAVHAEAGWKIFAAGGDGTLCEVTQGVRAAKGGKDLPVGFVSAGSMNFFAISAGMSDPERVALCIRNGEQRKFSFI